MALLNASSHLFLRNSSPVLPPPTFRHTPACLCRISFDSLLCALPTMRKRRTCFSSSASKNELVETVGDNEEAHKNMEDPRETLLYSFNPLPLVFVAALPGAGTVRSLFGPFVELVKSWNLPDWLVHWGHPGNMAVVLFAMGGYGTYLGFRIRFSDDLEEKAKAKDLHPKLLAGLFFFFALGATGGITSLLTSDKPIFERFHWPCPVDNSDHFTNTFRGKSWTKKCSWDIGKWYYDSVPHPCCFWTSTWSQLLTCF